jgi:hypothetical protein
VAQNCSEISTAATYSQLMKDRVIWGNLNNSEFYDSFSILLLCFLYVQNYYSPQEQIHADSVLSL